MESQNLYEVAASNSSFKTLLQAVEAAGVKGVLTGDEAYTVFAPTDDAFSDLPAGTLDTLLEDPVKLVEILKYHIVLGKHMSTEVVDLTMIETLSGGELSIKATDDSVMINDAKILIPDVEASNGVIHVVDKVLLPS